MAKSLGQLLKSGSGQLTESTDNTLNEALNKTDRPTAPLSPLAAAQIGTSADAAKMVGTKAQKTPALRQAVEGQDDLATFQRQEQVKTTDQSAKTGKAKQLQTALSGLESRVDQLKETKLQQAAQAAIPTVSLFDPAKAANNPTLQSALNKLNINPQDVQALQEANTALGKTAVSGDLLTADQLKMQYGKEVASQASQAATNLLSPTKVQELGFANQNELASVLGIPVENLNTLSIPDLISKAQAEIAKEYSQVQQLEQQANDPFAGAAARAEARKVLRQSGAEGIRSVESDMDKLADDIADDMLIEIGGKEYTINDALSNTAITDFVQNYLVASAEDKLKMEQDEPALTAFAQKHQEALNKGFEALAQTTKGVEQQAQKQAASFDLGAGSIVDANTMEKLFPGITKLGTDTQAKMNKYPLLRSMKYASTTPTQRSHITNYLKAMAELPDSALKTDLLNTSIEDLKRVGLDKPGPKWDSYLANVKLKSNINQMREDADPNEIAAMLGLGSAQELNQLAHEANLMERSGLFGQDKGLSALKSFLDLKADGSIDYKGSVRKLQREYGSDSKTKTIGDLALKTSPFDAIKNLGTYVETHQADPQYSIKSHIKSDMSPEEFEKTIGQHIGLNTFGQMASLFKGTSPKVAAQVADDIANETITRQKFPGAMENETIGSLLDRLDKDGFNPEWGGTMSPEQTSSLERMLKNLQDSSREARDGGAKKVMSELDHTIARMNTLLKKNEIYKQGSQEFNLKQQAAKKEDKKVRQHNAQRDEDDRITGLQNEFDSITQQMMNPDLTEKERDELDNKRDWIYNKIQNKKTIELEPDEEDNAAPIDEDNYNTGIKSAYL